MSSRPRDWLTSEEVMDLTGATYRQIDYWTNVGYLRGPRNPGSGHQRQIPRSEVPVITLMVNLRDCGIPPAVGVVIARRLLNGEAVRLTGDLLLTYAGQD